MAGIFTRAVAAVALWAALEAAAAAQGAPPYIASAWLQFGKLASPISATSSSAATQLPSGGNVGWLCNTGSNDAYVSFGTANTVTTSAATGSLLKTSSCAAYMLSQQTTPPTFYTWVATISASGTTIAVETGWGTPPAALVSSGGGGSGGASGTPTQTAVTVGTSSGTLVSAAAFTNFMKVCIAQSAANGIWVNWSGAAAVQTAPSEFIPPGQCDSWVKASGFLPTSAVTAIASASVAVTVIGN